MIRCATGAATGASVETVVDEALEEARAKFRNMGVIPRLALVFVSPRFELTQALRKFNSQLPDVETVGCTTAGELTELGLTVGGLSVMLLGGSGLRFATNYARKLVSPSKLIATGASRPVQTLTNSLCDSQISTLPKNGRISSLLLTDGLSVLGEAMVDEISRGTSATHELCGGGAADESSFNRAEIGTSTVGAFSNGAVAVNFSSSSHWGIGASNGFSCTTGLVSATRTNGNVVYELDSRPAFEVYRERAMQAGFDVQSDEASPFMMGNPLGLVVFGQLRAIRIPFKVLENGGLVCTGTVPQGASTCFLETRPNALTSSAKEAASTARARLGKQRAAGVLVFESVVRRLPQGHGYGNTLQQVRAHFPDTPIAGFLSFGEVARYSGTLEGWRDGSVVVAAIPDCP